MSLLTKAKRANEVLREAWLVGRVPPNKSIFESVRSIANGIGGKVRPGGLSRYLQDYPAIGRIEIQKDWAYDAASKEMRLIYSNSLFAPGCLRLKAGREQQAVIVFLPGNQAGADDVLGAGGHPQNMTDVANECGLGIACWDWPLQGSRRDSCLYEGLRSLYSAEREYSRILPALGTSLWREMVAELQFALEQLRRQIGPERVIHVIGWSMGGCFAYIAPLLGTHIATTTAAGSCAGIKDLVAEGKTRVHGYFFYPLNGLAYFDLEDVVGELLVRGHPLQVIHGEYDPGCLESTRRTLAAKAVELGRSLQIDALPHHGHVFSQDMKRRIIAFLTEWRPASDSAEVGA